ncbi:MAG: thrombospondin type 3 repeat-containing protein [Gammaproteobacteria bacterium]
MVRLLGSVLLSAVLASSLASAQSFSDEFNNSDTLDNWSRRHVIEAVPSQYTLLDANHTTPGHLTIVPIQTPGWFADGDAPLLFKLIDGNFSIHTRVMTRSLGNSQEAPTAAFNSAGLMARDPGGITAGLENHIMVNVGRQSSSTGSETKNTIDSQSALILDNGPHFGDVVLCRVANTFYSFRRLEGDADWVELESYDRPDMPDTLQVGMIVNAFSGADLQAEFDFIRRLDTPQAASACLPPPALDTDGDSINDVNDNCINHNNQAQRDTDGDGYGNVCDPDFNQDCVGNVMDLGYLRSRFFTSDPNADMDGNGTVNVLDLGLFRTQFFQPPGPSGLTDQCE